MTCLYWLKITRSSQDVSHCRYALSRSGSYRWQQDCSPLTSSEKQVALLPSPSKEGYGGYLVVHLAKWHTPGRWGDRDQTTTQLRWTVLCELATGILIFHVSWSRAGHTRRVPSARRQIVSRSVIIQTPEQASTEGPARRRPGWFDSFWVVVVVLRIINHGSTFSLPREPGGQTVEMLTSWVATSGECAILDCSKAATVGKDNCSVESVRD